MKIAILIYDGFTALDAVGPYEVLSCLPEQRSILLLRNSVRSERIRTFFL